MKRLTLSLMALMAVLVGATFTSCLNSDSENPFDYEGFFTRIDESTYLSDRTDGYTFLVSGLKSQPERAYMCLKLADGETLTADKTIKASLYTGSNLITRDFTNQPDTIPAEKDFAIASLYENLSPTGDNWSVNGYLNLSFKFYSSYQEPSPGFELVAEKVEDNVLTARLAQTAQGILPGSPENYRFNSVVSFRIPENITALNDLLKGLGIEEEITTVNGKIKVKIVALSLTKDERIELEPIEISIND